MQDMDLPSSSDSEGEEERHHGFVADDKEPTLEDKVKVGAVHPRRPSTAMAGGGRAVVALSLCRLSSCRRGRVCSDRENERRGGGFAKKFVSSSRRRAGTRSTVR